MRILIGNPNKPRAACFLLVLLSFLFFLASAVAAQGADDILAKVLAARGGLDKIRAINAQRISGHIAFGEISGPFLVELKRPLKMHMQLTVNNMTMLRVYDGKSAGWSNNPFAGKMNLGPMSVDELKNITEESDFDGPLVDYKNKGNQLELLGKDKVKDQEVWRLKLTTKTGDVRYYLFDTDSYLLVKWEGRREYEGRDFPVESYFTDYRDVDGLKFAFEIDSGPSATDITQKISVEKIELNPQINDAEFAEPAPPGAPGVQPSPTAPTAPPAPTSPSAPTSTPAAAPAKLNPPQQYARHVVPVLFCVRADFTSVPEALECGGLPAAGGLDAWTVDTKSAVEKQGRMAHGHIQKRFSGPTPSGMPVYSERWPNRLDSGRRIEGNSGEWP